MSLKINGRYIIYFDLHFIKVLMISLLGQIDTINLSIQFLEIFAFRKLLPKISYMSTASGIQWVAYRGETSIR